MRIPAFQLELHGLYKSFKMNDTLQTRQQEETRIQGAVQRGFCSGLVRLEVWGEYICVYIYIIV